jgi:hypothetical protein
MYFTDFFSHRIDVKVRVQKNPFSAKQVLTLRFLAGLASVDPSIFNYEQDRATLKSFQAKRSNITFINL